jgi:hypothetical protein
LLCHNRHFIPPFRSVLEELRMTMWLLIGLVVPVLAGTLLIWAALALAGRADESAPTPKPTAGE